jgi:hypothetical protein
VIVARGVRGGRCSGACKPGGSTSGCPSFVPHELVAVCRDHRDALDLVAVFAGAVPIAGAVVAPVNSVLVSISRDCDLGESFKAQCASAAKACELGFLVCTVGSVLATLSIAGIEADAGLVPLAALFAKAQPILFKLGRGQTPGLADIVAFGDVAAQLADLRMQIPAAAQTVGGLINDVLGDANVKKALDDAKAAAAQAKATGAAMDTKKQELAKAKAIAAAKKKSRAKLLQAKYRATTGRDMPSLPPIVARRPIGGASAAGNVIAVASTPPPTTYEAPPPPAPPPVDTTPPASSLPSWVKPVAIAAGGLGLGGLVLKLAGVF